MEKSFGGDINANEPPITSGFATGAVMGDPPAADELSPLMAAKAQMACDYVTNLLGPEGELGDGETWRCGLMAEELVRVLAHSGIRATVICGKCNGYDHVWVFCGSKILDPARGQFCPPYNYLADEEEAQGVLLNRIREHRERAGFTLQGLAEDVGSTKSYMWQLENKPDPDPGVKLGVKLARAFGTTVEELFSWPSHNEGGNSCL